MKLGEDLKTALLFVPSVIGIAFSLLFAHWDRYLMLAAKEVCAMDNCLAAVALTGLAIILELAGTFILCGSLIWVGILLTEVLIPRIKSHRQLPKKGE